MKRNWKTRATSAIAAAAVLATTLLCGAGPALAEEEEIAVADLPEAVVNAINERFPGATLEEAEREVERGQVIYDVEVEAADGTEYEVEVTGDGRILEIERDDEDEDEDGGDEDHDDDDEDEDDDEGDDEDDDEHHDDCDDDEDDDL